MRVIFFVEETGISDRYNKEIRRTICVRRSF